MKFTAIRFIAIVCLLLTACCSLLIAQPEEKFDFYARGPYRDNVPRPQSILRYEPGTFHTTYAQMEQVMRAIAAAAPDRVKVYEIGETNEHRMQYLIAVSSPENIARIDDIRAGVAKLADPLMNSAAEADQTVKTSPAIAWMAYAIHGNESASFEAMMQVLYQLAASNEPQTLDILKNCVTLIVPGENPDGHERFVTWYNSVAVGDPNHAAVEHREPWSIYGRLSHYRFDLNRDTLAMTQIETQHMVEAFQYWHPQVSADHHGQPSQFFFPPDSLPINPNLPHASFDKWNEMYGRANAKAFDANHWDYYVRDVFDAFYPGYWDMYPSLNGAIGMTFETDGGGFKGLRWFRDDGTIATLRSAMAKHYTASLTTLAVTAANRMERLKDYLQFRRQALQDVEKDKIRKIVIVPDKDTVKASELVDILLRSGITVRRTTATYTAANAHSYMWADGHAEPRTIPAGSYEIDLDQSQRILAKAILEPDTPQDKAFVEDNMARFRRNQMKGSGQSKEDYGFYDITAWSLPLAFGLDAYWLGNDNSGGSGVTLMNRDYTAAARKGSFPGRASISYIIPYQTDTTGPFVLRLLQDGYRVAVATKTMNAGGRNWPRGTFVIRVGRNPDSLHDEVAKLAVDMGINVFPVNSGFADEGDTGVGGESVVSLRAPKIAMVADEAVDQTSYGSIWWNFDRYGIRFTPMTVSAIKNGGLKDYNVLIMPDGAAGRYMSLFGAGGVSSLKEWIGDGGTLITARGASVWACLKDVGLTTSKLVGSTDDEEKGKTPEKVADAEKVLPTPTPSPSVRRAENKNAPTEPNPNPESDDMKSDKAGAGPPSLPPIASPSADANKVPVPLPGSIMRATVDRTTWLTYGLEQDDLPVMLASGYFFRYSKEGSNAIVFDAKPKRPLTLSGFVWPGNTERLLAGTSYLIDEPRGSGHIVLFAEEPFFRGIFRGTTRPFFNAIAFNGAF